ncbi:hypothetical protein LVD17_24040 [Fulvivirga ulvae]|uniref:hypothetical protein n=1 Tax=Fulvivirga ulvae TaxID=2904245 RepID=UPI001F22E5ED|nr:hypothetical protein [Fulvivirga ulvae]UII31368.1 hypothetical protein LVD17_24040 [Fulvivirga ulvae]
MALDIVIMDGDVVEFLPIKGVQFLNPKLQKNIKASGKTTINGKRVCVERDEKSVEIPCDYTTSIFSQPGKGTLTIKELKPGQLTQKTKSGRKKIILKGKTFVSQFKVTSPAKMAPPVNTADPIQVYPGTGQFITNNKNTKAT